MNYKHFFPTFRKRYMFLLKSLKKIKSMNGASKKNLNLGAGEGDLNPLINKYCQELYACDVNRNDVKYGQKLNQSVIYSEQDGQNLSYQDNYFDVVICMEVIEHVAQKEKVLSEIKRVLKPNGFAIITFPCNNYPFTYDPINYILNYFNKKVYIGAHAYGHEGLIIKNDFESLVSSISLNIIDQQYLSHYISGLTEIYWIGFAQRILKENANNIKQVETKRNNIFSRPKSFIPDKMWLSDFIIKVDDYFSTKKSPKSIGLGYLLQRDHC